MVLPFGITAAGLANAGTFLSGASSFLGALGIGGKQKRGPSAEDMISAQKLADITSMDTKMELSKKYGIHPLTMLGMPSASNGGFFMDGARPKKGIDLEAMGQGIDRMANVGRSNVQRELDKLALEQAQLSNDYLRVQIAGAQKAIATSGATVPFSGASGGAAGLVDIVPDQQISKNPKDKGLTAGKHAAFRVYDLGNGLQMEAPASDEGWAEAIGEMPWWYKHPKMMEALSKRHAPWAHEKKVSKKWAAPWDPRRYKK